MSAPPDDPTLEQVANQPEVQADVQQLRGNDVAVSPSQDFVSEYGGPAPTPNMENTKQLANQMPPPKDFAFDPKTPFQDFASEYGGPADMETAKEQAKQISPPKGVAFDPELDNEPDR